MSNSRKGEMVDVTLFTVRLTCILLAGDLTFQNQRAHVRLTEHLTLYDTQILFGN